MIAIIETVSLRELDWIEQNYSCTLDKLSILNQSDNRQPAQNMFYTPYWELIVP